MPANKQQQSRRAAALHNADITLDSYEEVACAAALNLTSLWKVRHAKLLQRPPPATPNAKLQLLLQETAAFVIQLHRASCKAGCQGREAWDFWHKLELYKPLALVTDLIKWLMCVPGLAADLAAPVASSNGQISTYAHLWIGCMDLAAVLLQLQYDAATQGEQLDFIDWEEMNSLGDAIIESGLLTGLPRLLHDLLNRLAAAGASPACAPVACILEVLATAQTYWHLHDKVGPIAHVAADVQRCARMLPSGRGAQRNDSSCKQELLNEFLQRAALAVARAQIVMLRHGADFWGRDTCNEDREVFHVLLSSMEFAEAGLQLTAAVADTLHIQHVGILDQRLRMAAAAARQQQQALGLGSTDRSSTSSSLGRSRHSSPRCALHPQLLDIPAVHQRLKLLPAPWQVYVAEVSLGIGEDDAYNETYFGPVLDGLQNHVDFLAEQRLHSPAPVQIAATALLVSTPALGMPALLLVVETALLLSAAAWEADRALQSVEQRKEWATCEGALFESALQLLQTQLAVLAQDMDAGFLVRRQVLLRQSGQQLLQLLRIQVQRAADGHAGKRVLCGRDAQPIADLIASQLQTLEFATRLGNIRSASRTGSSNVNEQALSLNSGSSLLASLAAAHPVDCFVLLESTLRAGLGSKHAFVQAQLLAEALKQPPQQMLQLLSQPRAVAAMASAVAGTAKAWAQAVRHADSCPEVRYLDALESSTCMEPFAAVTLSLAKMVLCPEVVAGVQVGIRSDTAPGGSSNGSGGVGGSSGNSPGNSMNSSSSTEHQMPRGPASSKTPESLQQDASRILLMVAAARSLVVLADALNAAAAAQGKAVPELLVPNPIETHDVTEFWTFVQTVSNGVLAGLRASGVWPAEGAAWETVMPGFAADTPVPESSNSSSSGGNDGSAGGSSGSQQHCSRCSTDGASWNDVQLQHDNKGRERASKQAVRWAYLLQLPNSRKLAATWECSQKSLARKQLAATEGKMDAMYIAKNICNEALQLCRLLISAVPLPNVCNNLSCSNLSGVSEAAVAVKVCGGCGAAYCSAACQAAHWRQHKKACRRMQALGLRVDR